MRAALALAVQGVVGDCLASEVAGEGATAPSPAWVGVGWPLGALCRCGC